MDTTGDLREPEVPDELRHLRETGKAAKAQIAALQAAASEAEALQAIAMQFELVRPDIKADALPELDKKDMTAEELDRNGKAHALFTGWLAGTAAPFTAEQAEDHFKLEAGSFSGVMAFAFGKSTDDLNLHPEIWPRQLCFLAQQNLQSLATMLGKLGEEDTSLTQEACTAIGKKRRVR